MPQQSVAMLRIAPRTNILEPRTGSWPRSLLEREEYRLASRSSRFGENDEIGQKGTLSRDEIVGVTRH